MGDLTEYHARVNFLRAAAWLSKFEKIPAGMTLENLVRQQEEKVSDLREKFEQMTGAERPKMNQYNVSIQGM